MNKTYIHNYISVYGWSIIIVYHSFFISSLLFIVRVWKEIRFVHNNESIIIFIFISTFELFMSACESSLGDWIHTSIWPWSTKYLRMFAWKVFLKLKCRFMVLSQPKFSHDRTFNPLVIIRLISISKCYITTFLEYKIHKYELYMYVLQKVYS